VAGSAFSFHKTVKKTFEKNKKKVGEELKRRA
jgi:hypothetical protein